MRGRGAGVKTPYDCDSTTPMPGRKFGVREIAPAREVRPREENGKGPGVGKKFSGRGFNGYKSQIIMKAARPH